MQHPIAQFWDERFDDEDYRYGQQPNAFLAQEVPVWLRPGQRVACLGDGEGRNGVWLAQQGLEVTSVEPSTRGIQKIQALAAARGVSLRAVQGLVPGAALAHGEYDAVVLIYVHAAGEQRRALHAEAQALLAPGGVVLLEAFTPDQLEHTSGGPRDVSMLYTAELLAKDFQGLQVQSLQEVSTTLDEGPGHQGPARVVRLVAKKLA